jgi:hypothetical protein
MINNNSGISPRLNSCGANVLAKEFLGTRLRWPLGRLVVLAE